MSLKFFQPHEFECNCGECGLGMAAMDIDFVERLDLARALSGVSYKLNSAIRCEAHNSTIERAKPDSSHIYGLAVDISTNSSYQRYKILYGLIKVGFCRIGIYKNYIHVDDDPSKPQSVAWGV
jgi:zinc D-Ala-D-Ala carboxypeptidase